ncbi:flagellar hook-associated protein FlgK [Sphingomonas mollis]|uniref:Flagellar hook-associated protein 1 n=1 Tax=Sphingomonas mollis TaxID=2795726 RepID=A0ABS0XRC4_9SPHN|nr:flagellar hook-associated protein FlgK [Sphingomonas sp. BT553]MBJ6122283.1 flagellar hook-associated protein FlgK [Sphingomonas sp. BT553]
MSDLLSIGASGVRAYQTALSVVGENVANVGATGYTRRSVRLSEMAAGTGAVEINGAGNGVLLTGVTRASDVYASAAVRTASADLSRTESGATWLDRIEKALTGNQLTGRVTRFFASSTSLAAEPDSSALRTGMLGAAQSAATAFTATGAAFDQIATDLDTTARQATTSLNSLGVALVRINDGLGRTTPGTTASAQLIDQRDQILDQMSAIVDVGVSFDALGRSTVKLGGAAGQTFVDADIAGRVAYSRNNEGAVVLALSYGGERMMVSPNGGALAGIVDGALRIAQARDSIESVARDFVTQVNANQLAGDDQKGAPGTAMFATGTRPTEITVAMTEGSQIAAASRGGGARDSSNLAKLEQVRLGRGYEASLTSTITQNATAYEQKKIIANAQNAIRDGATSALSSATGVNLDTEAVELMRFQQAYQASSRVIQIARDTLQTILDIR